MIGMSYNSHYRISGPPVRAQSDAARSEPTALGDANHANVDLPERSYEDNLFNIDLLELTASQESYLHREIQQMELPGPALQPSRVAPSHQPANFPGSLGTYSQSQTTELVRNANYGAPVYNFQNSVVHIHNH